MLSFLILTFLEAKKKNYPLVKKCFFPLCAQFLVMGLIEGQKKNLFTPSPRETTISSKKATQEKTKSLDCMSDCSIFF